VNTGTTTIMSMTVKIMVRGQDDLQGAVVQADGDDQPAIAGPAGLEVAAGRAGRGRDDHVGAADGRLGRREDAYRRRGGPVNRRRAAP
jgi:hypothetical protein